MVSLAALDRVSGAPAPSVGSSLKRKHTDADIHSDDIPSLPTSKRPRVVKFDPEVDVHILPDWSEKSDELVGEEVRRALERHANGDDTGHDQIKSLFDLKPTSSEAPLSRLLRKYVIALTNNVGLLNSKFASLVHAVVDCHWVARNEHFVQSYRKFLQGLLAVHPGYASSVMEMLVGLFLEMPSPNVRQQDDPVVHRVRMQGRVHDCLKSLLAKDSMLSRHLSPVLPSCFPFATDSAESHIRYIRNILRVAEYCRPLKGEITSLIMDRLVKIDVQIQVDLDDLEDDVEEDLLHGQGPQEEEQYEAEDSEEDSDSSEESLDDEERRLKEIKEGVSKLDAIMDLLFQHYSSIFAQGDSDEVMDTYLSLLSQFTNIILPTYRSRHAQFLVFHFGQQSDDFVEGFTSTCTHLAFEKNRPQVLRISAAAYLASFIARGAKVSRAVVRDVFQLLCARLEELRLEREPGCTGPDLRRYGPYYAVFQALLYTFCFRWRDLIVTENDEPVDEELLYGGHDFIWYNDMQDIFRRNIYSKLNPLKICSPLIVDQFARIAHHLHFLYVYPLIETNKRVRLTKALGAVYRDGVMARETALTMKKSEDSLLLDAYFPFDPYVLPRSKRWVENDYVEWKPIPGMDSAAADGGVEDDEADEEDSENEEATDSDSQTLEATAGAEHNVEEELEDDSDESD